MSAPDDPIAWLNRRQQTQADDPIAWLNARKPPPPPALEKDAETAAIAARQVDLDAISARLDQTDKEMGGTLEGDLALTRGKQQLEQLRPVGTSGGAPSLTQEHIADVARNSSEPWIANKALAGMEYGTKVAIDAGKTGAEAVVSALDAPSRVIRAATNPDVEGFDYSNPKNDFGEWNKSVLNRARADEKSKTGSAARAYANVTEGIGKGLAQVGGALGAQAGMTWDVLRGEKPDWEAAKATVANPAGADIGQELSGAILTDPTNIPSVGTKGASVALAGQVARALKASGKADDVIRTAAQAARLAAETHGGTQQLPKVLDEIMTTAGADPKHIARVFGKNFETAGKSGLEVGFMGVGNTSVADLASKVGVNLPENLGTKAMERGREFLAKRKGVEYLNPHKRADLSNAAMLMRAAEKGGTNRALELYKEKVAPLMPADPARREELVRFFLDPEKGGKRLLEADLTPDELKAMDAWSEFFEGERKGLVDARLLEESQIARNSESERYVPRQLSSKLEEPAPQSIFGKSTQGESNSLRARAKELDDQAPLGSEALFNSTTTKAHYDPHEIVANYVPKMERAKAHAGLERYVADNFAEGTEATLPPFAKAGRTHTPMTNSAGETVMVPAAVANEVKKAIDASLAAATPRSGALGGAFKVYDAVMDHFKKVALFPMPRYHINNMLGDSVLMFAGGLRDPGRVTQMSRVFNPKVADTEVIFRTPAGRVWTKADVVRAAQDVGIDAKSVGAFDLPEVVSKKKSQQAFQEASERAQGVKPGAVEKLKRNVKEYAVDVGGGGVPGYSLARAGQNIAQKWEAQSNMMFFIDRLAKGDSKLEAVRRLREIKPDYSQKSGFVKAARRLFPFAQWQINTLKNMPRTLARAPYAVNLQGKVMESVLGADPGDKQHAPSWKQRERGQSVALNDEARRFVRDLVSNVSGDQVAPNIGVRATVRNPFVEALSGPVDLLKNSNPDPILQGLNPIFRGAAEFATARDMMTGQGLERMDPLTSFANAGTPLVPSELEARPEQQSWMRYLPQLGLGQLPMMALNAGISKATDGAVTNAAGVFRPYSELGNQRQALALLNALGGLPLYFTTPSTQDDGLAHRPLPEAAAKIIPRLKREEKEHERGKSYKK